MMSAATVTVTVRRPGLPPRVEQPLPNGPWCPTSLLAHLLDWLDQGRRWADIDPDVRRRVAADLRVLADQIETA